MKNRLDIFQSVIDNSEVLFVKTPQYEPGLFKKGKYINSIAEVDKLSEFFNNKSVNLNSFNQYSRNNNTSSKDEDTFKPGYCIRTGIKIPFNPGRPLCADAFKTWTKYNDPAFHEAYCHFSGEPSLGETSFGNPILKKNLSKANEFIF